MLGKTLEDVAFAADTDAGNLSRIERDEQRPSLDLLEAIASALNIRVSALYESAEQYALVMEQTSNYHASVVPVDDDLAQLIKYYQSLSDEGRVLATNLIAALKKTHAANK